MSEFNTPAERQMLDLGKQARLADYPISAYNLSLYNPLRCWWVAGWVDTDNELKQQVKMEQVCAA